MKLPFKINKSAFRLKSRYLLTLVNENSLSPLFEWTVRKSTLIFDIFILVLMSGVIWYILFAFTPLNGLMPKRFGREMRAQYMELAMRVDSLSSAIALNDQYARNVEVLLGDSLTAEAADTTGVNLYDLPLDSLMGAGKAEERFVKQFEASERFNLSVLSPIAAEGMIFYPPVSGVSLKSNSPDAELPAVIINSGTATPISAAYQGTVVDAYYTTGRGVTVAIQHPNNFLSVYSGLGDVFVSRGDKVKAGQRIGMSADTRYPLTFMLWHDGSALDPAQYIDLPKPADTPEASEPFIPTKKR